MTTVANLDHTHVDVSPGEAALCQVEVHNSGSIVESYVFEIVGGAEPWATVEPSTISVYPGTSERVTLHFNPPRSAQVLAGEVPFALRVIPAERPEEQVVPEGVVRVLPFFETTAEIVPRTSRGRWGGLHEVSVSNLGNAPRRVAIAGSDPDNRLRVSVRPPVLTLGPGQASFVKVRARSRRTLWRGHPVTLPFQVGVSPDEALPTTLDAATVQTPVLPQGLSRALAALLVLVLIGVGLWYALLRPAVKSLAEEVTQDKVAPVAKKADQADGKANEALDILKPSGSAPVPTNAPLPPSPPPTSGVPGVPAGAQPFADRLAVSLSAGSTRTDTYRVPSGKTFVLTDIFLQNPQGDEGRLDLIVDGTSVLTVALSNFRDLDYHLVSPIEVRSGRTVGLRVSCRTAGPALDGAGGGGQCRDFALLSGYYKSRPAT